MKRILSYCATASFATITFVTVSLLQTDKAMAASDTKKVTCVSRVHNLPLRRFGRHGVTAMQRNRLLVRKPVCCRLKKSH